MQLCSVDDFPVFNWVGFCLPLDPEIFVFDWVLQFLIFCPVSFFSLSRPFSLNPIYFTFCSFVYKSFPFIRAVLIPRTFRAVRHPASRDYHSSLLFFYGFLGICWVDQIHLKTLFSESHFGRIDEVSKEVLQFCRPILLFFVMSVSTKTVMTIKSYQSQAEVLVKNLTGDSLIQYTSILGGLLACKMIYDLTQLFSTLYFTSYAGLTKMQRIEWNNRGMSTLHAVYIAAMSLYFVFWSDLFADNHSADLITFRSSPTSTFALGVSVGYFIADLGLILWFYPSLGGKEFVLHHTISGVAVAYAMLSGEGQLYTFMVLVSEVTTPEVNMRWFLDTAGLKRSSAYLINGVMIFFAWLVARVLLFVYMFYHVYLHFDQVMQMHPFGFFLVFVVPSVLAAMNLMWFGKIIKGLLKTLTKAR